MRILFLCLGNICRSPAAEAITREKARVAGLDIEFDSAGTGDWHAGEPPYGPMIKAAQARGYDLSTLRARQLNEADFAKADFILAMDENNLRDALDRSPKGARAEVRMFLDARRGGGDVSDPYFTRDFDAALDQIEAGAEALVADLLADREA
ncbi:low molecular weight phosphotyrosine protein phosphatase [Thioclava sp. BHET1]|uniref:protein-tyrosine-phosphatase n=1 Tax=Thioclava dalianensis TaxID=1185766 RepID=A0A074TBB7_9RHOB|nr:low molecular weight protein-tyrosine-phosphatase [Thioclava dalianensis]KEP69071.1 phosphotyrosine protein phosphatase [Thioclava dalianensis]TMV90515.1 low molecular weight phosphotyrosine protein phosphatase [Thioclava sp. BHET1]SFM83816.1 protein-tyrosine phosphatase [Thioclava dalianensis]